MEHKYINNNAQKTLVLFHGTGGDEQSMIAIANKVTKNMNYLSFRGDVVMNGLRRFCKVSDEGLIMDEQDMFSRIPDILKEINRLKEAYNLNELWAMGFSNGANTLAAMLLTQETPFEKVILLRPMNMESQTPPRDLKRMEILIHSGRFDDIIPMQQSVGLEHRLKSLNAKVNNEIYELDHRMRDYEIKDLAQWFKRRI